MTGAPLTWLGIFRLGLVQTALGAIVVLTTSTLNRVMVVELALPAAVPGALVGWHFALQLLRPRLGHGSDVGGRRTPWIVGGMVVLALGGAAAAAATAMMASALAAGLVLAALAFTLIGLGVGAAGTSLLVLLAKRVGPDRRAPAATIVWMMMILGFAVTAAVAGKLLDPFSFERMVWVTTGVSVAAVLVTLLAVAGVEGPVTRDAPAANGAARTSFRVALREAWADPQARRFTIFVFVSMLAYSAQDLILEPFAGAVFGFTPGESTSLSGVQHAGVLAGMILVAVAGVPRLRGRLGSLRAWVIGGCVASAAALAGLVAAGFVAGAWPLRTNVALLGAANGAFAVAAIGAMMMLATAGRGGREGVRMGMWGAAQAIAFGAGGFAGTVASDAARYFIGTPGPAYAVVFAAEAALFVAAARLAGRAIARTDAPSADRAARGAGFQLEGR